MSTQRLLALTGLAGVLAGGAGLLAVLIRILNGASLIANEGRTTADILLMVLAVVLMTFFLLGLYGVQQAQTGVLAVVVLATFVLSNMLFVGSEYMKLFLAPEMVAAAVMAKEGIAPLMGNLILGLTIFNFAGFGYVTWRAGVLPRWLGLYFLLHALVILPAGLFGWSLVVEAAIVVQSIIFAWIGYRIWAANGQLGRPKAAPA